MSQKRASVFCRCSTRLQDYGFIRAKQGGPKLVAFRSQFVDSCLATKIRSRHSKRLLSVRFAFRLHTNTGSGCSLRGTVCEEEPTVSTGFIYEMQDFHGSARKNVVVDYMNSKLSAPRRPKVNK